MIRRRSRTARERMARIMIARERKTNLRIARKLLKIASLLIPDKYPDYDTLVSNRENLYDMIPDIVEEAITPACHEMAAKIIENPNKNNSVDKTKEFMIPHENVEQKDIESDTVGIQTYIEYNARFGCINFSVEVEDGKDFDERIEGEEIEFEQIDDDANKLEKILKASIINEYEDQEEDLLWKAIQRKFGYPYADENGILFGNKDIGGEEPDDLVDIVNRKMKQLQRKKYN